MIVTLTPNPSVDRTLEVPVLERGEVLRASAARTHPGGKGVNVARALVGNGIAARAVLPIGGWEGEHLLDLLAGIGIEVVPVRIAGSVRENVTVAEPDGTVTKLNAPGPQLSAEELTALVGATVGAAGEGDWVALCGSVPPGSQADLYRHLVEALHEVGARVAVDTSGAELAVALEAGPDLVKPNAEELAEVVARPLATLEEVVDAAYELLKRGAGSALVTLGRDGAVLVRDGDVFHATAPPVTPRSTVGAGDATLAGYLAASGEPQDALRQGVAWGAAAVRLPGTQMPTSADVRLDEVQLVEVVEQRPIEGGEVS